MNCTKVEKLLPLYVEGDLSGRDAARVQAHLSSCGPCRALAEEFRLSQERIHNFGAPDFGAEFYEGMRRSVLAEINSRPQKRPSFFQTLSPLFTARPATAFSLALLILLGALSFAAYRSALKRVDGGATVAFERGMGEFNLDQVTEALGRGAGVGSVEGSAGASQRIASSRTGARQKPRRDYQREAQGAGSVVVRPEAATATVAQTSIGNAPAGESTAPPQVIARMEIQTSDPNIRIIWLGRKASE